MDVELVILRILHIGFGVFWVGSALFMSLILEPRLRAQGPAIQRPAMMAIAPIMGPAVGISGGITIAAGITLYLRLPRGGLDRLFDDAWSWAIFVGFLVTIVAYGFGIGVAVTTARMAKLGRSIVEGEPPSPEVMGQMQRLSSRVRLFVRLAATLLVIAVSSMASARFLD